MVSVASRPTADAPIHSLKLITSLLIVYHIFSEISASGSQHQRQRRFPVLINQQEDAQVGANNFNWRDLSSVKLIKLPRESLKTKTDSGEKLRLSKYTQVGTNQGYHPSNSTYKTIFRPRRLFTSNPSQRPDLLRYLWISMSS